MINELHLMHLHCHLTRCDKMSGEFAGLTPSQMAPPREACSVDLCWALRKFCVTNRGSSLDTAGPPITPSHSTLFRSHLDETRRKLTRVCVHLSRVKSVLLSVISPQFQESINDGKGGPTVLPVHHRPAGPTLTTVACNRRV